MTVGKFKVNKPPTPPKNYKRKTSVKTATAVKKKKASAKTTAAVKKKKK